MRRSRALAVTLAASAVSFPVLLGPAGVPAAARARACTPGSGPDLRGEDLADADDLPRNLRCADLTGATLNGADLTHRDLTGAILRDASLQGATLSLAHADGADLRGADFTGADLGQFRAKRVKLRGALLIGVYAEQAEFPRSDFTGAILSGAVLTQADLTGSTFASADLTKATMGQVKARGADFTRATMRGTRLGQAHLERAVFTSADLNRAVLTQASLDGADLNGANVNGATFGQARDLDLTGSRGTPADVPADALSPSPTEADRTPEAAQEAAHRAIANDPVRTAAGLLLVVLSGIGLGLTLIFWGLSHRRRKRDLAAFEKERVAVMDDLTRFGDEIGTVDAEMKSGRIDGAPGEWRAALDAYEAARHVLTVARTPYELQGAASAVQHGRASLHRVRTLLSDHGGQR